MGCRPLQGDPYLFFCHTSINTLILLVYVNDILVNGSCSSMIDDLISYLHNKFSIRDLGHISYFLGIQVHRNVSTLHLSQVKYIQDLLDRTSMGGSKSAPTPRSPNRKLSQSDGTLLMDPIEYRSIVGALQYMTITRPDIAFAVNKACQFMSRPTDLHWQVVKQILCYLKGTITYGLQFQPSTTLDFQGFSDADWASCPDDHCRLQFDLMVFYQAENCF